MKYIILTIAALTAHSGLAMAERQIYSTYPNASFYNSLQPQAPEPVYQSPPTYMVYPGREQYGQGFGSIPRHPGDYRDAVDRGSWTSGGSGNIATGARSFDIR